MKVVVLISCTKSKRISPCEAQLLYDKSTKFKKSLAYAKAISDDIYVISAKHGLISLDTIIAPYDETLKGQKQKIKTAWGNRVANQISELYDVNKTKFLILAGRDYYAPLQSHLPHIQLPLYRLNQGNSLAKLDALLNEAKRS